MKKTLIQAFILAFVIFSQVAIAEERNNSRLSKNLSPTSAWSTVGSLNDRFGLQDIAQCDFRLTFGPVPNSGTVNYLNLQRVMQSEKTLQVFRFEVDYQMILDIAASQGFDEGSPKGQYLEEYFRRLKNPAERVIDIALQVTIFDDGKKYGLITYQTFRSDRPEELGSYCFEIGLILEKFRLQKKC